jgi:predicted nuclease of predicted toxin-antitoxin system
LTVRILIDECLNWRLSRALTGHYAISVHKAGLNQTKNGALLAAAIQRGFDVFLTGDRNLSYQQNTTTLDIAVVVLEAGGTQLHQTLPLVPKVLEALKNIKKGQVIKIG